jgi:quercetin dioxygenase-like cupin family protein
MRHVSGPHFIFEPDWLRVGQATEWHTHNFPHNTVALAGDVRVELREGDDITVHDLMRDDPIRWALAPAGVEHRVTLLSEGARAVCFFSHFNPDTGEALDRFSYTAQTRGAYA